MGKYQLTFAIIIIANVNRRWLGLINRATQFGLHQPHLMQAGCFTTVCESKHRTLSEDPTSPLVISALFRLFADSGGKRIDDINNFKQVSNQGNIKTIKKHCGL
jgi:hypothetical protein